MKKIVGTILAASLALSAFAAEPAANFVMADFTGDAEFGWKADFADSNDVKMGMYNNNSASIKFGIVDGGDKSTTGDGIWGELKIKADATSVTNGSIKLGDEDPADGGYNIKDLVTQDDDNVWWLNVPNFLPKAVVDTAKIHFVDGDFSAALNLLPPSLEYGEFSAPSATGSIVQTGKIGYMGGKLKDKIGNEIKDKDGNNLSKLTNGFALELRMADLFNLNFKLADNGLESIKDDKKHIGMAIDASLKAVENLDFTVAGTFNFGKGEEYTGFGVNAGYKLGFGDTLYLKPGFAFTSGKMKSAEKATNCLMVGALFGWGAADQEPNFAYVPNKTTEGVSVGFKMNLVNDMELNIGLYDQSLAKLIGLDDMLSFKTGVLFTMANGKNVGTDKNTSYMTVAFGEKAKLTLSPIYIGADFDFKLATKNAGTNTEWKNLTSYKLGLTLGSEEIIDNTNIYVSYNFGNEQKYDQVEGADKKKYDINTVLDGKINNISVGAKIHF